MKSLVWTLIQYDRCSYKKRRLGHINTQREDYVQREDGHQQAKEKGYLFSSPSIVKLVKTKDCQYICCSLSGIIDDMIFNLLALSCPCTDVVLAKRSFLIYLK